VPASTPTPLPVLTLEPGQFYFSIDGIPSLVFSRNVAGYQQAHYATFLDWAKEGGTRIVRIQLDSLGMGYTSKGEMDPNWALQWGMVFDLAEQDGIYILPVFSGWFDWNAGQGYSTWNTNQLNAGNGGPVKDPAELFQKGSPTQQLWLKWMKAVVQHWQGRRNIAGWEIFSEVNLASGAEEVAGIDFVNQAAAIIREVDAHKRPVTASIADTGTWPNFYRAADLDFINIHPYPPSAQLDRAILSGVRKSLAAYQRPVLIGESGLSAESPAKYPPNAEVGVRHAIWAGVVSGAMNGRGLYWEDSFAIYFAADGMPWLTKYKKMELPAALFASGVDFSGFKPLVAISSPGVWGGAIGNEKTILGWYRDAGSEPPDWPLKDSISGETVLLEVPGAIADWQIDFYDTKSGTDVIGSDTFSVQGGKVTITLPDFTDDIAFKMHIVP